ncbi:MAG TPA: NAD(P)(+) transhydrogenase (Re/Si-specific) subunit beta [Oscillatoriaceae cyanobacterium]
MLGLTFGEVINLCYLVTAILFIVGLKRLSHPTTARQGNAIAGVGMLIAVVATLLDRHIVSYWVIAAGMVVGGVIGYVAAKRVQMTAMPQMVALFNGTGGGAAALVAASEFLGGTHGGATMPPAMAFTSLFTLLIGSISFAGSAIAFAKLQELMSGKPVTYPGQNFVNGLLGLGAIALLGLLTATHQPLAVMLGFAAIALLLGVAVVLPIGGADMPVIIAVLNSLTGMAAASSGFLLQNNALIVAGALVGASGTLLTVLMCKAMHRSLANVLFGAFGSASTSAAADASAVKGAIKDITAEDALMILENAQSVIIVPGYGLAVARAQHAVRELADLLAENGAEVKYAIHPVAGRMPGHMNVLLAEADVPYDQLFDLEEINDEFAKTDVVMVLGANDVVNPAAKNNPASPIYGMPVLNVDQAKNVIVVKRSMNAGFAGIENELFYQDNTMMLFGDAKKVLEGLVRELKGTPAGAH